MRHSRTLAGMAFAAVVSGPPVAVGAQAATPHAASHMVKKGDTLWDLAQQYLSDPLQWPQIYQLNKEKIKDPHWIYPDQVLSLPGGTVAAPLPAETAPEAATRAQATASLPGPTIFNPATRRPPRQDRESLLAQSARTAVRRGDYEAAPFMWVDGGPIDSGKVVGSSGAMGTPISPGHRPIGYRESALIQVPKGIQASAGLRLLVYRLGAVIPNQGQVVVPTGVVEVTASLPDGQARATVIKKFEDVFAGHGVTQLDTLVMPLNVFPARVEFGLSTRVVWLHMQPLLPSEGHHLIVAATRASGIVTGDQMSIRIPRPAGQGDEEIAIAQVTRVTPWGVSAIIVDVANAGVAPGVRVQVSAKMP